MSGLWGADPSIREARGARTDQAKANSIFAAIIRSSEVLAATLREIFDESAYQRFLDRSQLESSPSAYAIFLRETEQASARRPRCC